MTEPNAVLITYEENTRDAAEQISTLVGELLVQPGISISIMQATSKRDASPVREPTNSLGFISESAALPQSLDQLDNYLRVCKHNRKLARELLNKAKDGTRRSKRIAHKKRSKK